jgi:hypothetical protein
MCFKIAVHYLLVYLFITKMGGSRSEYVIKMGLILRIIVFLAYGVKTFDIKEICFVYGQNEMSFSSDIC